MPHTNDAGLGIIMADEGLALRAYPDPGTGGDPWTIAFGHTIGVHPGDVCTPAQAKAWLAVDVGNAERAVAAAIEIVLTPNQFSALVSWQYNTGAIAGSAVARCLNAGDRAGALVHLQRYVYSGGRVMPGLEKRRAQEAALFCTK